MVVNKVAKEKTKEIFCVECGAKNKSDVQKCVKCHKNPNPKDHAFKDYIMDKISGKTKDNFFELLTKFLKKHLYGTLMTCSIVFTGVSILTNAVFDDSYITQVNERPTTKYLGEGLEPEEVVKKYVDAAKDNDLLTIAGLRLEDTLPEVYSSIEDIETPHEKQRPLKTHTVVNFADIYFREGGDYRVLVLYDDVGELDMGRFGDYPYYRYSISIHFCQNNVCNPDEEFNSIYITDQIELVEVDGNYYVTGEQHHYEQRNLDQIIARGMIYNAKGDMTKVDFSQIYNPFICGEVEDCLGKFGGMEERNPWEY